MDNERVAERDIVATTAEGEPIAAGWHDGPLGGRHPHLVQGEHGLHADEAAVEMARRHAEADDAEAARLRDLAAHEAAAAMDTEAADDGLVEVPVQRHRRPETDYGPDEEAERVPVEDEEPPSGVDHYGVIASGGEPAAPNEPWGSQ